MPRLVAVSILLAGLTAGVTAAPAPKGKVVAPPGVDRTTLEKLEKGLTAAVGDRFAFVGAKVGWDRHGDRYWLATLRAREEGEFVLRCGVKYEFPPEVKKAWKVKDGANWTYRIAVGKEGAPRVVEPGGYAAAYPLACVRDQIVVPVRLSPCDRDHRFELTRSAPGNDVVFRSLKEIADRGWAVKAGAEAFALRNGAADVLKLVSTRAASFRTRSGSATHHNLSAVFEAVKGGRFGLELKLGFPAAGGGLPGRISGPIAWAFDAVPKGRPLTVTVPRWDAHEYRGKYNSHSSVGVPDEPVRLRVGDRLAPSCGGYATPGLAPVAKHLPVEVRKRPAVVPEGPWRQEAPKE
jgi:hypothetical protein